MNQELIARISARFECFKELVRSVEDEDIETRLGVERSKSLKEHFWCIIGARESYSTAMKVGQWQGFSCSLSNYTTAGILDALTDSEKKFFITVSGIDVWSVEQSNILLSLFEHETMHEGQIIRHIYGLGGRLPNSWKWA